MKEYRDGRRRVGVGGGDPQTVLPPPPHNTDTLTVNDLSSLRPPCMCCNVKPADHTVTAYDYVVVFTIPKINHFHVNSK